MLFGKKYVEKLFVPETELVRARQIVLGSPGREVAMALLKDQDEKNGKDVILSWIQELKNVDYTPGGDGFDLNPNTYREIANIQQRSNSHLAGFGHSHLMEHRDEFSPHDKATIDAARKAGGNQVNMLFKITGRDSMNVQACNNKHQNIPISITDENGRVFNVLNQ